MATSKAEILKQKVEKAEKELAEIKKLLVEAEKEIPVEFPIKHTNEIIGCGWNITRLRTLLKILTEGTILIGEHPCYRGPFTVTMNPQQNVISVQSKDTAINSENILEWMCNDHVVWTERQRCNDF